MGRMSPCKSRPFDWRAQIDVAMHGLSASLRDRGFNPVGNDALIVFFASHGSFLNSTYAIVTHDFNGSVKAESSITGPELIEALRKISAYRQFVVVDACYAGGLSARPSCEATERARPRKVQPRFESSNGIRTNDEPGAATPKARRFLTH